MPLSSFYRHSAMADGHLGKCKDCTCRDAREHREKNRDRIVEYDAKRNASPERKAARVSRRNERRKMDKNYDKAHNAVARAIRSGALVRPSECSDCGNPCKPDAHHPSFSAPLSVMWLCKRCHAAQHIAEGKVKTRQNLPMK